MLAYVVRRFIGMVPTLFVIVTLSFFVLRLAPGGPFDEERPLSTHVKANLQAAYGLDKPLLEQYSRYVNGLLRGDLGPSLKYSDFSVAELMAMGLPTSLQLGIAALLLAVFIGVSLGVSSALCRNEPIDRAAATFSAAALAMPSFVFGPLLILVFCLYLDWLPIAGAAGEGTTYLILPVITLAVPLSAVVTRLTRAGLLEALSTSYVMAARARGLSNVHVIIHHALRPALLPTVSYLGPASALVLSGSLVVESLFSLPGIGRHLIQGALNRDYPIVMGMVIVYSVLTLICNFLADILRVWMDPRVRYD